MENYLVVDGQRFELTKEEFEKICKAVDLQKKNPFAVADGQKYYYINDRGEVISSKYKDHGKNKLDELRVFVGNACADYEMMKKRANYEAFERILWRYSEEHGGRGRFYPRWSFEEGWDDYYIGENHYFGPSFVSEVVMRDAIRCAREWLQSKGLTEADIFY